MTYEYEIYLMNSPFVFTDGDNRNEVIEDAKKLLSDRDIDAGLNGTGEQDVELVIRLNNNERIIPMPLEYSHENNGIDAREEYLNAIEL